MATRTDRATIMHQTEFETTGNWGLARRSLGVQAFGINVVEIPPGERIPEHDETDRDQEEVFVVLEGEPTLVVDGERYEAPKGTYARIDVAATRTVENTGDEPAIVLIVSAPRTSGYTPMEWA